MLRAHPIIACAAGVYVVALVVTSFVVPDAPEDSIASSLLAIPTFLVLGVLLAMLSVPRRWWVALGFTWLGAAWVEAAQAVWLPTSTRARVEDVILGCIGGAIGVGAVMLARRIAKNRAQGRTPRSRGAAKRAAAPISATGAAPRTR